MIRVELRCDGCGVLGAADEGPDREKVNVLRQLLSRIGWRTGLPRGRDLCPECRIKRGIPL
jgi:hypothetical protein